MKTGVLNRKYQAAKTWYQNKKQIIGAITLLVCLAIAMFFTMHTIDNTYGGVKGMYTYPKEEYNSLANLLKNTIVDDPYIDLKNIDMEGINYTCDYNSKDEVWKVTLSKDGLNVRGDISRVEGKLETKVTYDNKAAHIAFYTLNSIILLAFAAGCLACVIYLAFIIVVVLAKFVCLVEKVIIHIKS